MAGSVGIEVKSITGGMKNWVKVPKALPTGTPEERQSRYRNAQEGNLKVQKYGASPSMARRFPTVLQDRDSPSQYYSVLAPSPHPLIC